MRFLNVLRKKKKKKKEGEQNNKRDIIVKCNYFRDSFT
jgi:hypothetical protein